MSVSDGIVRNQIFFLQSQFDNLIIIEVENGRHGVQNEFSKVVDVQPRRKFGRISLQTTAWAVADVVAGWAFKKKNNVGLYRCTWREVGKRCNAISLQLFPQYRPENVAFSQVGRVSSAPSEIHTDPCLSLGLTQHNALYRPMVVPDGLWVFGLKKTVLAVVIMKVESAHGARTSRKGNSFRKEKVRPVFRPWMWES